MNPIRRPNSIHTRLIAATVFMALAVLLAAACGDDDGGSDSSPTPSGASPTGPTPQGSRDAPAVCTQEDAQRGTITTLDFNREIGATFKPGEDIEITFTIANCGDRDITLEFNTTQRYSIFAEDQSGNQVWSSTDDEEIDDVEGTEVIEPNDTRIYRETWDQTGTDGEQVPDGVYKISAFSIGCVPGHQAQEGQECRFGPIRQVQIGEASASET